MQFNNVKQEVFEPKDITSLVETIRVEVNENFCLCFDLELHLQRLLESLLELDFKLAVKKESFELFFLNQIKNKLQYKFARNISFAFSEFDENLNMLRLSKEIYKLRLIYNKDASFAIELEDYKRDLSKKFKVKILSKEEFHIESSNPIWQHKFLPRPDFSYYLDQAYDEVIWCDENDNICEGSFTAIVYGKNNSPLANTLKSTSLKKFSGIDFIQIKRNELKDFSLINSMLGFVDIEN